MFSKIFRNNQGAIEASFDVAPTNVMEALQHGCKQARGNAYSDEHREGVISRASRFFGHKTNPVVPNVTDIQPWLYYDRLTAAASSTPSTTLLFFTTPLSATKTKLDTNLKQASRLPDPKHFLVLAIRFIFDAGMSWNDINAMIKSYYIEFEIGDKLFAEGHFDLYPGGAGAAGFSSAATTATTTSIINQAVNNGLPSPNAINNWGKEHGIHILQGQTFAVRAIAPVAITLGAATTPVSQLTPGLNLRCVLDGILYREAQ